MPDDVNPYAVSEASLLLQPAAETFPKGLASRISRLGAVAIDAAIIGIADYLVSLPAYLGVNPFSIEAQVLNLISGFGIFLLINGYTLQTRGQTIGKLILGIRIVDATSGELAGLPRIAVRREFPLWLIMYAWYETWDALRGGRLLLHLRRPAPVPARFHRRDQSGHRSKAIF